MLAAPAHAQGAPTETETLATMRKATSFMVDEVAYRGGFLWNYLPDLSRGWGEMEASRTMVWLQSPGTSTVGNLLVDAYHATGDRWYYDQAAKVAGAIVRAQHPAGGWNYVWDHEGEAALKHWYETVFAQGWRLEEFLHYYGNATFDDAVTTEAATFLLRMYLDGRDPQIGEAVHRAIGFIRAAQYENGGWPQRYPFAEPWSYKGKPDYTRYITLNDNVAQENVQFLVVAARTLGLPDLLDNVTRAMDVFIAMQGAPEQAAFALQYTPDLRPTGARSYEPDAYATHTTQSAVQNLLAFYELTADPRYLAPVDAALDWLERVRLPGDYPNKPADRSHATFIEFKTDSPIFVKRRGSNIVNGSYYAEVDARWKSWPVGQDPSVVPSFNYITHYNSWRAIDIAALRARKSAMQAKKRDELLAVSPLVSAELKLPAYFSFKDIELSDITSGGSGLPTGDVSSEAASAVTELATNRYWASGNATPNEISNPYLGPGPSTIEGDPLRFSQTKVGDRWDTSPYDNKDVPVISTRQYISKMGVLIRHLNNLRASTR